MEPSQDALALAHHLIKEGWIEDWVDAKHLAVSIDDWVKIQEEGEKQQ